jgi:hypothetical protein
METLTLIDGTVFENSYAVAVDQNLFIYTQNNYNLKDIFDPLYLQGNTDVITYAFADKTTVYNGYNKLISVRDEGNGLVTAVLKKVV